MFTKSPSTKLAQALLEADSISSKFREAADSAENAIRANAGILLELDTKLSAQIIAVKKILRRIIDTLETRYASKKDQLTAHTAEMERVVEQARYAEVNFKKLYTKE